VCNEVEVFSMSSEQTTSGASKLNRRNFITSASAAIIASIAAAAVSAAPAQASGAQRGVNPNHTSSTRSRHMTKILMVLSGVDHWTLTDGTKDPSGYWAEEFVVPHQVLTKAGFSIDIAAPTGGKPHADPRSLEADVAGPEGAEYARYIAEHEAELSRPRSLSDVNLADYAAIFIPGGHGPMEDLAHDPDLGRLLIEADKAGKLIAPLCHGPAALLSANLPGGRWQFAGRHLTVFTDNEERLNGTAEKAPWLVETVLKARGVSVSSASEPWGSNVVVDGNLVSGQNPASSRDLAEKVVAILGAK
jgi:putative intracellular protease/amidase